MPTIKSQIFSGAYRANPLHSSFAFAVRHSGVSRYRGSLTDVAAELRADGDRLALGGAARVQSISIVEPPAFREHVLAADFFDAERHPEITFRSTDVRLDGDGRAEVDGELTIRGVTRAVAASGEYAAPRTAPFGPDVAGLELRATIDRRDFGFDWQTEMPDGSDVLGWDVELEIALRLEAASAP